MSKARWTKKHFNTLHQYVDGGIRRLSATRRRRDKLSSQAVACLKRANQPWLPASNMTARIVFAEEIIKAVSRSTAYRREVPYFAVTLVPFTKLVQLDGGEPLEVSQVKTAVLRTLAGLNYIGAIDLAPYRQFPTARDTTENIICVHAHVLVWGCDEIKMRRIVSRFNRETEPILNDFRPGDCRPRSDTQPKEWIRYTLKFPVKEYQLVRKLEDDTLGDGWTETSRWKQLKKLIRPGTAALLANKLARFTIPDILLSGGDGCQIASEAVRNARQRLKRDLQRSTRRSVRRVFGRHVACNVADLIQGIGSRRP
ncbi:MAG: hypothetical protein KF810_07195 [Rhizobiaceae bacterium]|nr:hypothetical protein [Rhizobiaceae bacterium]